ncbi:MAG: SDR family oxidoreductase [Coriobacteriia bacterium]
MPRTVVVTGGNRGIGAGIVRAFVAAGDRVLVGARTDTHLEEDLGEAVRFARCDVRSEADLAALADAALEWTGRLDVWVNCAGFSAWRRVEDVDETFWDEMLDTNLKGTFFGCKVAAGRLDAGGAIVNVSSIAGRRGSANNSVYCASKFGVTGVTQSLAKELGPGGVRVNAVCPVYVDTDGLMEALEGPHSPAGGGDVGAYLAAFAADQTALKRLPSAAEVGAAVVFLASPAASAITGQSLHVDCGVMPA